jgi:hypothetical protein
VGLAHPVLYWSAAWIVALSLLGGAVGYLTSLYLNQLVDSSRRATLLSVKGLALNLGYGWISLGYGVWVARLPEGATAAPVITAFSSYLPYGTGLFLLLVAIALRTQGAGGQPGGYTPARSAAAADAGDQLSLTRGRAER